MESEVNVNGSFFADAVRRLSLVSRQLSFMADYAFPDRSPAADATNRHRPSIDREPPPPRRLAADRRPARDGCAQAQGDGPPMGAQLAALLSAFGDVLALDDRDAILRRAVAVARDKIGLARAAIFLFDRSRNVMLGTWGSDLERRHRRRTSDHVFAERHRPGGLPPRRGRRRPVHDLRRLSDHRAPRQ